MAFESLCSNDLPGLDFDATRPGDAATGEAVLRRLGFESSSVWRGLASQAGITGANYAATWWVLRARKPAFQMVEDAEAADAAADEKAAY